MFALVTVLVLGPFGAQREPLEEGVPLEAVCDEPHDFLEDAELLSRVRRLSVRRRLSARVLNQVESG